MNLSSAIKTYHFDTRKILDLARALPEWRKHSWYNSTDGSFRSEETKELDVITPGLDWPGFALCSDIICASLASYCQELMAYARINRFSPVRINRYETGTLMRIHSDHIHSLFDGQSKGIPVLSIVANLNDDYEGGAFIINGKELPLAAGEVVVFPSCFLYPHEVTEVTKGTRYSFVSWAW